jgi:hypothetical protein
VVVRRHDDGGVIVNARVEAVSVVCGFVVVDIAMPRWHGNEMVGLLFVMVDSNAALAWQRNWVRVGYGLDKIGSRDVFATTCFFGPCACP